MIVTSTQEAQKNTIFQHHRPFFDLDPISVTQAPLSSQVPLLDYDNLDNPTSTCRLQRHYSERFRFSLIEESGLSQYARLTPAEVPEALRTPQWQHLCNLVEQFSSLTVAMQVSVVYLLRTLCFHRLILKLVPDDLSACVESEEGAMMVAMRANVHFRLYDKTEAYIKSLENVIHQMPESSYTRYAAALALLVHSAKSRRGLEAVRQYRSIAQRYANASYHDRDSFDYFMLQSRFLRGASFEPFLAGDRERLKEEMDLSEEYARATPAHTPAEHLVKQENLGTLLETRTREAISLGDLDLALARTEEYIRIDPLDAKAHIEVGEVLFRRGDIQRAATEYRHAAELAPPGGAIAWYMTGYCYERLGDMEQANMGYLTSLQVDPEGISPVQGLIRTTKLTGQKSLQLWAEEKAEEHARRVSDHQASK